MGSSDQAFEQETTSGNIPCFNQKKPNECLDPDTGLNHTIGVAWNIPGVCGQAHCDLRENNVYISYAFCGSAHAEYPCYLSAEPSLPYPYCCPRSFCPTALDIETNEIDTGDYEEELQMAANDVGNYVSVEAPEGFKNYDSDVDNFSNNYDNIVSYDVDMDSSYNSEEYQIDWDTLFGSSDTSYQQ